MGKYGSSIIHFDDSFEIKSRLYGDESQEYAGMLINKGHSLKDMNTLDKAIQAYNQCLKILTKDENSKQNHKYSR